MAINSAAISGAIRGIGLGLKKAAPTIMTVSGIGLMIASTGLAIYETKEGIRILDEWSDHMDKADIMIAALNDPNDTAHVPTDDWNVDTVNQARINEHIDMATKMLKNYAPAILAGLGGIALILGGNGIQLRRVAALGGALEVVSGQFDQYRNNVVDQLGTDADAAFMNNGTIETINVADETGATKSVKGAIVANPAPSALSLIFDEANPNWSKDAQSNKFFLETAQAWAQNVVDYSGEISLAEVYKRLGFNFDDGTHREADVKKVAYAIGWRRGDIVDFGLSELWAKMESDGTVRYEPSMWITPNCRRSMFDGKLLTVINRRLGVTDKPVEQPDIMSDAK